MQKKEEEEEEEGEVDLRLLTVLLVAVAGKPGGSYVSFFFFRAETPILVSSPFFPPLISVVSISVFLLSSFSLFPPVFFSFSPLFFFFFSLSVFFFFSLLPTSLSTLSSPVFIGKYMGREAYYPCPVMDRGRVAGVANV